MIVGLLVMDLLTPTVFLDFPPALLCAAVSC